MRETSEGAETHATTWVPKAPGGTAPGWLARVRERVVGSVWQPIWFRMASVALGMVGLSAIGMFSTLDGPRPVELAEPALALGSMTQGADRTGQGKTAQLAPPGNPNELWLAGADRHTDQKPSNRNHGNQTHGEGEHVPSAAQTAGLPIHAGDEPGEPPEAPREAAPPGVTADGKVILNTADAEELQRLPGVGQKRAESILALRARLTRFKSPTDLLRVRGIGIKTLKKMLPHLVLDPPVLDPPATPPPAPATSATGGLVRAPPSDGR